MKTRIPDVVQRYIQLDASVKKHTEEMKKIKPDVVAAARLSDMPGFVELRTSKLHGIDDKLATKWAFETFNSKDFELCWTKVFDPNKFLSIAQAKYLPIPKGIKTVTKRVALYVTANDKRRSKPYDKG